jgi:hypothetical protein
LSTELLAAELAVFPAGSRPLAIASSSSSSSAFVPPAQAARQQTSLAAAGEPADARQRLEPLQRRVAAGRLGLWWRRRLAHVALTQCLPPLGVLAALGRPGWLSGRGGGLRARRNHWPAPYTQAALAGFVGCWLAHPPAPDGPLAAHRLERSGAADGRGVAAGAALPLPVGWGAAPGVVAGGRVGDALVGFALRLFGQPSLAERYTKA